MAEVRETTSSISRDEAAPGWISRLLAVSYYCGVAPILGLLRSRKENPYARFHFDQALSVYFVLFVIGIVYAVMSLALSYILVFHRGWYEDTPLEPTLLMIVRRAFLCWLVVWAFSVFWALAGSWRPIPLIGRLAKYKPVMKFSFGAYALTLALAALTFSATVHASTLVRTDNSPAEAYLLYDDMGVVPHWLFTLGFYPISKAATEKWGEDSVVVKPFTKPALADALYKGKFVFILSHGTEEGLYTADFKVGPDKAARYGTGKDLQFVYITGCDSGAQADAWEHHLAPAEVVTFNRLSAWVEHIYWLLFEGADKVRELE